MTTKGRVSAKPMLGYEPVDVRQVGVRPLDWINDVFRSRHRDIIAEGCALETCQQIRETFWGT